MVKRGFRLLALAGAVALAASCSAGGSVGPSSATPSTPASASAPPSLEPSPSGPPAPSGAPDLPFRYRCDATSGAFPATLFNSPGTAELDPDPSSMALREYVQDRNPDPWVPRSGWWSTGRTAQRAWFIARRLPTEDQEAPPFVQIVAEPRPPGWQVIYHEDCRPMADVGKLNIGIWEFGAFAPPSASSRRFPVAVHEPACSSGRGPAGRVREPTIVYRETEIYIVFTITPLRGTQDCPGAPAARAVVELREPIGDRKLVDASTYPFHDPNEPPF